MTKSEERIWWESLSRPEKRQVEAKQWELADAGFGVDSDFKMKTCWEEAVRQLYPNGLEIKPHVEEELEEKPIEREAPKQLVHVFGASS